MHLNIFVNIFIILCVRLSKVAVLNETNRRNGVAKNRLYKKAKTRLRLYESTDINLFTNSMFPEGYTEYEITRFKVPSITSRENLFIFNK